MNMKYININYAFLFVLAAVLMVSCTESDKVFNQIIDAEQRGAILRQTEVISNSVLTSEGDLVAGQQFAVDLEYQDTEDGNLLSQMDVFLAFIDNTDDGVDNNQAEIMFESFPASAFSAGDRGLPIISYIATAEQMLMALGMNVNQLGGGGDQFVVRFELALTDGRRFSAAQNSGTITGSYFASPFTNLITVVCEPPPPTAGTWAVETNDSYGDDWNGASVAILLDGADEISIAHAAGDNTQNFTFEVPAGTTTISIMYVSGDFDCENSFTVTSANGFVAVSEVASPRSGIELLDFCAGGF